MEKKIKHVEKKYEKIISKLNHEMGKMKKTTKENPPESYETLLLK